jgi:hypothetical protein
LDQIAGFEPTRLAREEALSVHKRPAGTFEISNHQLSSGRHKRSMPARHPPR